MRRIIMALAAVVCVCCGKAQSMEYILATMPDSIVPVMTKNNRLDCIDFYKSNMKANVENVYGGKCELLTMGDDYLLLKPTQGSTVAVKRLAARGGDTLLVVVYTYMTPARESTVAFYTPQWERKDARRFITPPAKDDFFLTADTCDAASLSFARTTGEDAFVCAELSENEPVLTYSLSLDLLAPSDAKKVRSYVLPAIKYRWNGKAFTR